MKGFGLISIGLAACKFNRQSTLTVQAVSTEVLNNSDKNKQESSDKGILRCEKEFRTSNVARWPFKSAANKGFSKMGKKIFFKIQKC